MLTFSLTLTSKSEDTFIEYHILYAAICIMFSDIFCCCINYYLPISIINGILTFITLSAFAHNCFLCFFRGHSYLEVRSADRRGLLFSGTTLIPSQVSIPFNPSTARLPSFSSAFRRQPILTIIRCAHFSVSGQPASTSVHPSLHPADSSNRNRMLCRPLLSLFCLLAFAALSQGRHLLNKRQTFHYPDNLREFAQNYHPGTRVIHGTLGRFAPQEWPGWYTRTIFKWNGESRMSPYSPNDLQYNGWRYQRIANGGS